MGDMNGLSHDITYRLHEAEEETGQHNQIINCRYSGEKQVGCTLQHNSIIIIILILPLLLRRSGTGGNGRPSPDIK